MDKEAQIIKLATARDLLDQDVIILACSETGIEVHQWSADSVCPVVEYPTAREAASRVLQLLHIGPVAPQTHPELACINSVSAAETPTEEPTNP